MGELGISVCSALKFLEDFFKDVSKLITTVEESMINNGQLPYGDSACFWYLSRAYYSPSQWLPKYLMRIYSPKRSTEKKADKKSEVFSFLYVCLKPANFKEPIAIWGVGKQKSRKDIWNALKPLNFLDVRTDLLPFVKRLNEKEWESLENKPDNLSKFYYKTKILTDFNNAQKTVELVVDPLIKELRSEIQQNQNASR